ncbi:MAG TPA: uroporphyrinogen-III synthase [Acidimicrobiales bacterium]
MNGDASLAGLRVVVTRARDQASTLVRKLEALGAEPIEVPVIAIAPPPDDGAALRDALTRLASYEWVVVTSANGVDALCDAASAVGADLRARPIAVVGTATADRLRLHGVEPALIPERFVAEGLLEVFPDPPSTTATVLLAQADLARDVLARGLRERGWNVDAVVAYRTVPADVPDQVRDEVARADAVTFTSASTVELFVAALGRDAVPPTVVTIGPITSDAARALGIEVTAEADPHTIDGLVDALVACARRGR